MTAQVAVARAAAAGVAAPVLALTPAAWTAGDARPVLRRAQADLRDALVALRRAEAAARAVRADVR